MIYNITPELLNFVLNAAVNWVLTPDLLKIWGYKASATCKLCSASQCHLAHILSGCKEALNSGRYKWRHDSVLKSIATHLAERVAEANQAKSDHKPIGITFEGPQAANVARRNRALAVRRVKPMCPPNVGC